MQVRAIAWKAVTMMGLRKRRRAELERIAATLKRLSRRPVPRMLGEAELRERLRRQVEREGRFGIDGAMVEAVGDVIDSHVIEMRAEILRQQTAEAAELGELEATLRGLTVRYGADEEHQRARVKEHRYLAHSARRRVEVRDTPMPAGPDGVEDPGYQTGNPADLVGSGVRTRIILWIVLGLAMLADLIAFRQVVERLVNDSRVLPMVVALTVATTYIAHLAGSWCKAAKEATPPNRVPVVGWTLAALWTAMGLAMFLFRLLAPPPVAGDAVANFVNGGTPAAGSPVWSALLLLFLYVLTGAVAICAGYQRPRVEIEQYRRISRRLRKQEPRLAALSRDAAEAEELGRQLIALRTNRETLYAVEVERCEAAAQRLKAELSMMMNRLLRSGGLPWFRRVFGGRVTLVDSPRVIDVEPERDGGPDRS